MADDAEPNSSTVEALFARQAEVTDAIAVIAGMRAQLIGSGFPPDIASQIVADMFHFNAHRPQETE